MSTAITVVRYERNRPPLSHTLASEPAAPENDAFADIRRTFGRTDLAAFAVCAKLSGMPGPISGEVMLHAILAGSRDSSGRATKSELREFLHFDRTHPDKLSAEARAVLETYQRSLQAAGGNGIERTDYAALVEKLSGAHERLAWRALDRIEGTVRGDEMIKAILVTVREADGKTGERELQQLEGWARVNAARLSAIARQVLVIYCNVARAALKRGQQKLTSSEFALMAAAMRAVKR